MARVSRLQAFSPVHVNSAWMAVGAYPATRADVENPQVRKGANDEFTMRKLDDNEVKARRLMAVLEERELAQVVRDAGLWEGVDRGAQRATPVSAQSRVEAPGGPSRFEHPPPLVRSVFSCHRHAYRSCRMPYVFFVLRFFVFLLHCCLRLLT